MLIRYKKNLEKIAMGLLSFMPVEKDIKKLQQTIKEYDTNDEWQLYLWKEEDDILGAIGIQFEDGHNAVVQHISVTPSHRNQGIGKKMVQEIKRIYEESHVVCADNLTENFYNKCDE